MHHCCVVIAKSAEAERQLRERIGRFVRDRLTFEPDEIALHVLEPCTYVVSVSAANRQIGIDTPVHLSGHEACLVGGLPTFERFPQFEPSSAMRPAAWLSELLREHAPSRLYTDLGGAFSVVRATADEVTAFSSFCGYDSLFYLDNGLYAAVGTRPSLVAAFQSAGACSAFNPRALGWILSTTMILGTETPWQEVKRQRTDEMLTIRGGRVTTAPVQTAAHTPPMAGETEALYDRAVRGLVDRFEWYLRTGLPFNAHLTGGKDSRTILALLFATGSIDRVREILTIGSEENGDVIVARQIAAALGLKNHVVRVAGKRAVQSAEWEEHEKRFRFSPWKYDMYLTPYDGWKATAAAPSPDVVFMGGGGEIIRQKGIAPDGRADDFDAIVHRFVNWYYRHDALGLLSPAVAEEQRSWIRSEVGAMIEGGIVNLQQRFYIEQRMANWGNAHFRNSPANAIAALVDLDLARLMHQRADMADDVPYELLSRTAPELRRFPFVNDQWLGRTRERAEAEGTFHEPVTVAVEKNFPWQFMLYREHRNALLRDVLPSLSAWEGVVVPDRIQELIERPIEPFNSSHVKMLFGLIAGTHYLLERVEPARDFASTTDALRVRGSEASTARSWFAHRREASLHEADSPPHPAD